MTNAKYIAQAKEAIERVFGNTDQPAKQTLSDLVDIKDEVQERINAILADRVNELEEDDE